MSAEENSFSPPSDDEVHSTSLKLQQAEERIKRLEKMLEGMHVASHSFAEGAKTSLSSIPVCRPDKDVSESKKHPDDGLPCDMTLNSASIKPLPSPTSDFLMAQRYDLEPPLAGSGVRIPAGPSFPDDQFSGFDRTHSDRRHFASTNLNNLPKRDLVTFDGDPGRFWLFMRCFEANVLNSTPDPTVRLTYLIQYCTGEAKRAIESCLILDPLDGFNEAMATLRRRFGRPHMIARCHIEALTDGLPLKPNDFNGLSRLAGELRTCYVTLKQLKYEADLNASRTIGAIVKRLPSHLQFKWAERASKILRNNEEPQFMTLIEFVEESADVVDTYLCFSSRGSAGVPSSLERANLKPKASTSYVNAINGAERSYLRCLCCGKPHYLDQCDQFRELSVTERMDFCLNRGLCRLCLKPNHTPNTCRSRRGCGLNQCKALHHPLLHTESGATNKESSTTKASCFSLNHIDSRKVSLGVIPVIVTGPNGVIQTNALLDNGSDTSLIDSDLLTEMGIKGEMETLKVNTVSGCGIFESQRSDILIRAVDGSENIQLQGVRSVNKLSDNLFAQPTRMEFDHWTHLADLCLPEICGGVRILIGSDNPYTHWTLEQRCGKPTDPYAVRTPLGWIILGPISPVRPNCVSEQMKPTVTTAGVHSMLGDPLDVQCLLEQMYNADFREVPSSRMAMSLNDKYALSRMQSSFKKNGNQYEIALPWRTERPCLPKNEQAVWRRLESLRRRLMRDSVMLEAYTSAVSDYIRKGYAEKIPDGESEIEGEVWYIPHHAVYHPRKPGKARVVFDCQFTYQGTSINKQLLPGPDLTNSLVGVLLRFRMYAVAVASDIEAMFHQVKVPIGDRNCLRFLWWEDGNLCEPPCTYRMTVHPFGATSSPSCASFALRQAISDCSDELPENVITFANTCFYVDDCLFSCEDTQEAINLISHLRTITSNGGFHLTKWISNKACVVANLPKTEMRTLDIQRQLQHELVESALGLNWNISNDCIQFTLKRFEGEPTRRNVLSFIASVYDPLGIISPVLLEAKLILQDLVRQKLDWDSLLSVEDRDRWTLWLDEIELLNTFSLNRCIKPVEFARSSVQLHCFSDASGLAYGAALYLRLEDTAGQVKCNLLLGKSKVNPIRAVSIPRLELAAVVLSVRLASQATEELNLDCQVTFWTDSMIVLQLIRCVNRRLPIYVANRVSTIHQHSHPRQWRFVGSGQNPADLASRGLNLKVARDVERWLSGPEFLAQPVTRWPRIPESLDELPAEWSQTDFKLVLHVSSEGNWINKFEGCPTWICLQRRIAILIRFKEFCRWRFLKNQTVGAPRPIRVPDIHQATLNLIRLIQEDAFSHEINILETAKTKPEKKNRPSRLRKLNPFLHNDILRVGGRLERLPIAFDAKHPILMPQKHFATRLLILHHHLLNGHAGVQHTLADIRSRYWIIGGVAETKRVLGKCASCVIRNAKPLRQLMAPLIPDQFSVFQPAFHAIGVDYFGPLIVKRGRIHEKRYGCLFTCLSTRAVHIEVSPSMDTDSFLCAFSRFAARRGWPSVVYSDNGQNFHGAEKELCSIMAAWDRKKIENTLMRRESDWVFNPPCASHRGGLWERLIRSIRTLLRNILGDQIVTDEVLHTTLTEVERILNDRPLIPTSDSPDPYATVSPAQLLTPCRVQLDERPAVNLPIKLSRRWRQVQQLSDTFWKRWIRMYLPTLQQRQKWLEGYRDLKKGDLVIVCDIRTSRGLWPKGIVQEVVPSEDKKVRQAIVKTTKGIFRRDIRQLCLLEATYEEETRTEKTDRADRFAVGV